MVANMGFTDFAAWMGENRYACPDSLPHFSHSAAF
jgi:hypothetical protein